MGNGQLFAEFHSTWEKMNMEYLHYAGSTVSHPFHPHIVAQLLELCVCYMSLPPDNAPAACAFGVLMAYHVYSTQPCYPPLPIIIPVSAMETVLSYQRRHGSDPNTKMIQEAVAFLARREAWKVVARVDLAGTSKALLSAHDDEECPIICGDVTDAAEAFIGADADDVTLGLESALDEYNRLMREVPLDQQAASET
jgi:hypothetical protein